MELVSCGKEAFIHCFKILAGIEPYADDFLTFKFSLSFFTSSSETSLKLKLR